MSSERTEASPIRPERGLQSRKKGLKGFNRYLGLGFNSYLGLY